MQWKIKYMFHKIETRLLWLEEHSAFWERNYASNLLFSLKCVVFTGRKMPGSPAVTLGCQSMRVLHMLTSSSF